MKEELNSKKILYVFFVFLGLTFILFFGATYAFFTYEKLGTKTTTIAVSNAVKLHYQEGTNQINIPSGLPMDDARGKTQTDYFEFTVTGETSTFEVPYIIAARVSTVDANRIPDEYISVYLTEVNNNVETQVLFTTYDQLNQVSKNNHVEEKLYDTTIPVNTQNYTKTYRLRLWINEAADYTPTEENGVQTYPMQGKELALTVNVYTEADVIAACEPATLGDMYCFDTECFRAVTSECNGGDTVLLAENVINYMEDDYCEPSGLQAMPFIPYYYEWHDDYPYCSGINEYSGISRPNVYSDWEGNTGPGLKYNGDFDASTPTPYPYVYDFYSNDDVDYAANYFYLLRSGQYNLPQTAKMRLLSKEEYDLISGNSLFDSKEYFLGSASSIEGSSINMWSSESANGSLVEVRPALIIPTSDLSPSAKYVYSPTNKVITNKANQIANDFNIDYDEMDIDYTIIDGYIGNNTSNYKNFTVYSTISLTSQEQEANNKKIFNYFRTEISDDSKLYDTYSGDEIDINSVNNITSAKITYNGNDYNIAIIRPDSSEGYNKTFRDHTYAEAYYVRIGPSSLFNSD